MRILLCHNNYRISGGAEVFYHEVGRVLAQNKHHVAYFSANDGNIETPWISYFPPVLKYNQGNILSHLFNFTEMVYNRRSKAEFARLIRDFKPDLIHAFAIHIKLTPSILDAASEAGVPVIMSCNDYKHICPNYKLFHHGRICEECKDGRFYHAAANRCCHKSMVYSLASTLEAYAHSHINIYRRNIHTFLFASEFMTCKTEEFWSPESFRWQMLRNPFDSKKYAASSELGDYALYFGRLIDEKGVNVLLDAAAIVPEMPLVVVGDGPDEVELQAQAKSLGLTRTRFVGPKWGQELDQILRNCRFVVVPSLWYENFPYVILQSFAMGKPVVGSSRGGIPELVEHGIKGLVYEATDASSLARAMSILMSDAEKAKRMGLEAKRYVDSEFNDNRFYNRLVQIYNEVLE